MTWQLGGRLPISVGLILFAVVIPISAEKLFSEGPTGVAFWLLLALLYAWIAFWLGYRLTIVVEFNRDRIIWQDAFRTGSAPFADVVAVAPLFGWQRLSVIRLRSGRKLIVVAARGYDRFAATLQRRGPGIDVDVRPKRLWASTGYDGFRQLP
jgi:hypothetical protein